MDMLKKAIELVQEAHYADDSLSGHMRADAAIYAQVAIAQQLERVAAALEKLSGCVDDDGELKVFIPHSVKVVDKNVF